VTSSTTEQDLLVTRARLVAVALLAVLGLTLTVVGAWFAIVLGAKGTATFSATGAGPVLLGPSVLNRVSVPVTVTARAGSGPVFLGVATPQDSVDAVGSARHDAAVSAAFPARTLQLEQLGSGALEDPSGYHVWRATATDTVTLSQDQAPQAVVVYPTKGGPVDVSVSYSRTAWFLEALVALVVGLIVLAFAGGWWWPHRHRLLPRRAATVDPSRPSADPSPAEPVEPVAPTTKNEETR